MSSSLDLLTRLLERGGNDPAGEDMSTPDANANDGNDDDDDVKATKAITSFH